MGHNTVSDVSPQEGDVRRSRKEKDQGRQEGGLPGLVYCHKKGTWKRKEKEKTKEGKKVAPAKARFRVPSTKNFFFWFTSIWVWKRPVSFAVLAPTRLSLRGSNVRRKFRKRTTLRSESSTLKGLLYAGWRSRCEAFVARKVRTIAGAKCEQESCHLISDNQLLFTSWISSGDSILGL
jgi:hypothetical protein